MAAVEEAAAVAQLPVSAQVVGNAFVQQYYHILHHSPGLVHRFYQDVSKLGRPEEDGSMSITTTMQGINDKIVSLNYEDYRAEIKSVDTQESFSGGFHVLVTGYLTGKDNTTRNFAQTFFLAPQDKGYFVLNDVFRYVDSMTPVLVNDVVLEPIAPTPLVQENHVLEQTTPAEEAITGEVYNPPDNGDVPIVEQEVPVAEVVNEVQDDTKLVVESSAKIEEVPKKSYASIVMHLNNNTASFSPPPSARKPPPKRIEQVKPAIEKPVSSESVDNGNNQEGEADGYSIYIKGLPMVATDAMLEEVFKKFGGIKKDGIQVRSNKQQGFCFGFVEYEEASSVQKALEASPVAVGGRQAVIEEKRSTNSRGSNNRGRFQSGRGSGFRNDGGRGRGNYGGVRSFNGNRGNGDFNGNRGNGDYNGNRGNGDYNGNRGSGDFNGNRGNGDFNGNRGNGDFSGNRGGNRGVRSSSRDGYQNASNNGGGRVNRNGGMANGSAKFTAPRVPATA